MRGGKFKHVFGNHPCKKLDPTSSRFRTRAGLSDSLPVHRGVQTMPRAFRGEAVGHAASAALPTPTSPSTLSSRGKPVHTTRMFRLPERTGPGVCSRQLALTGQPRERPPGRKSLQRLQPPKRPRARTYLPITSVLNSQLLQLSEIINASCCSEPLRSGVYVCHKAVDNQCTHWLSTRYGT